MARLNGWVCKQVCLYRYWSSTDSQMAKLEIAAKELFWQMFCQKVRKKNSTCLLFQLLLFIFQQWILDFFELQQFSLRSRLKPSQACLKHECKWLVDCVYAKVHTGSSQHIKSPFHLCIAVCMFEITILQNDQMLTSEVSIKFPSFITSKTPLESFCIFVNWSLTFLFCALPAVCII